jgi:transposase-like protein
MKNDTKTENKKRGAPAKYDANVHVAWGASLAKLGATGAEIAEAFGISERTLYRWCNAHVEFCQALKKNKSIADSEIAESLYMKATGRATRKTQRKRITKDANGSKYEVIEKVEETLPPDTTALIFWLKNRQPQMWRDKPVHDDTDTAVLKAAKELVKNVESAIE